MSLSAIPVPGSFTSSGDSSCSVPVRESHLLGQRPKSELTYNPSIDLNVSLNVSINSNCSTTYSNSTTASSKKINEKQNCCENDTANAVYHSNCHLGDRCDHRLFVDSASRDGASIEKCPGPAEFDKINPISDTEDTKQSNLGISSDSHKIQKQNADNHRETCRLLMRGRGCVDRTSSLPKLDG